MRRISSAIALRVFGSATCRRITYITTTATSPNIYGIRGMTTDNYPNGERISISGADPDNDLMFKTFVAQPLFSNGFESGDTSAWSGTP